MITEINNSVDMVSNRLHTSEKRICELEDRWKQNIQKEATGIRFLKMQNYKKNIGVMMRITKYVFANPK